MQFGRIDHNAYTLDFQYPFSAVQAFAVALANVTQRLKWKLESIFSTIYQKHAANSICQNDDLINNQNMTISKINRTGVLGAFFDFLKKTKYTKCLLCNTT